ncbi:MAG: hypothetical protein OXG85_12355 [Chloroflexi bacterium]|nr:hypothetical protein [Chloroflexota bacterium]
MIKLNLVLGAIMLILGLLDIAPPDDATTRRVAPTIEKLEVAAGAEPNAPLVLELSGIQRHSCQVKWRTRITYFPQNVDIHLYQEIREGAPCADAETAFQHALALDSKANPPTIIVNDQVWLGEPGDARSQSARYIELTLLPVTIDEVRLLEADESAGARLRIQGWQAVGCATPEIYSLRHAAAGAMLGVFNAIDADTVCAALAVSVDDIIDLPATFSPTDTLLSVNAFRLEALEEQMVNDSDKVLTNIFRVDVNFSESRPLRISLDVQGEHPDGCEYPVLVEQRRQGGTIDIEVYRNVPADVVCPMILKPYRDTISLEGAFEPGDYTINVNSHSQAVRI